jgi:Zn-dependent peptidase ImmA (M78 family)
MNKIRSEHPFKPPAVLLKELGITEPSELVIEAIAQHCGATVIYEPLDGCQARILGFGNRAIITVNARSPLERRRFSAAHELGHWTRDRGKTAFACTDRAFVREWGDDNPERGANRYAAALLLPPQMLKAAAVSKPITFATVQDLMATFQTSRTATAIRLIELTDLPAMVTCYDQSKRLWFWRSSTVPNDFWPVQQLGDGSIAAALLANTSNAEPGATVVDANEWIDRAGAARHSIVEDSVRAGTGTVLSLLWWKDESQILDADDDEDVGMTGLLTFGRR